MLPVTISSRPYPYEARPLLSGLTEVQSRQRRTISDPVASIVFVTPRSDTLRRSIPHDAFEVDRKDPRFLSPKNLSLIRRIFPIGNYTNTPMS